MKSVRERFTLAARAALEGDDNADWRVIRSIGEEADDAMTRAVQADMATVTAIL